MSVICLIPYTIYLQDILSFSSYFTYLIQPDQNIYTLTLRQEYSAAAAVLLPDDILKWSFIHADDFKIFNISWIFMFTFWFLPKDYKKKAINIQHFIRIFNCMYQIKYVNTDRQTHTSRHLCRINLCISIIKWIWGDDAGC